MIRILLRGAAALLVVAPVASGQLPTGPKLLVDAQWLSQHLHDRDLVVLTVGPDSGYPKEHIAGSRFVHLRDLSTPMGRNMPPGTLTLEMPAATQLQSALEGLGISNDSRIVVVADSEWNSPSTRVVMTLGYVGLGDRTYLLDGGMTAWRRAGLPVTAEVPAIAPGYLRLSLLQSVIVDADYVTTHRSAPRVKVIDARDSEFYSGPAKGERAAGHIPGAASIPFASLIADTTNLFLSPAALLQKFSAAGVQPGDTVVTYCHVGQQATLVLFAARLLGHPVKLYDGSFQDWSIRKLPTEGGKD